MRVCLFGAYRMTSNGIPSGGGGVLLRQICERRGFEVVECHEEVCISAIDRLSSPGSCGPWLARRIRDLSDCASVAKAYVRLLLRHRRMDYDVMLVPHRGLITLPLAKLLHRGPIIYFPTLSIHNTLVNVRGVVPRGSVTARLVRLVEKTAARWADITAVETSCEAECLVGELGLPREKFRRIGLAACEEIFTPVPFREDPDAFTVLYFGGYLPQHGVDVVAGAAGLLKARGVRFVLCGDGRGRPEVARYVRDNGISNARLPGMVAAGELVRNIRDSDVCLGLFGRTRANDRIVTNKVHQILASGKPLITKRTPATAEAGLVDGENCLLTESASPDELAGKIMLLKEDAGLRRRIASNGHRLYAESLSVDRAGEVLAGMIEELCRTPR